MKTNLGNNLLLMILSRKLAGLALRQCIDLGYHRNTKHFAAPADVLRAELRKRVFWCAYVMETQAAVMLGRPLGVPYQEVDAEVGSLKAFDLTRNLIHLRIVPD